MGDAQFRRPSLSDCRVTVTKDVANYIHLTPVSFIQNV
jgi:hypothetical protein